LSKFNKKPLFNGKRQKHEWTQFIYWLFLFL